MELSFEYFGSRPSAAGQALHWTVSLGGTPVAQLEYDAGLKVWRLDPILVALRPRSAQWTGKVHGSRIRHVPAWLRSDVARQLGVFALECLIAEDGDRRRAREAV